MHLCGQLNLECGSHCAETGPELEGRMIKTGYSSGMSNVSSRRGIKLSLCLGINIFSPRCRGKDRLIKMISSVNVCVLLICPEGVDKGRVW